MADQRTLGEVDALLDELDAVSVAVLEAGKLTRDQALSAIIQWAVNLAVDTGATREMMDRMLDETYTRRGR